MVGTLNSPAAINPNNLSVSNVSLIETPRQNNRLMNIVNVRDSAANNTISDLGSSSTSKGNHLLPSGLRYLLVNNTMTNHTSPNAALNKESPRDFVNNTRKIFYTEKSIIAKKEETQKLKEYVVMEHERLAEAKRIFQDDKLRFEKYVKEQEVETAETKDKTEKFYNQRLKYAEDVRTLQEEIEKQESEIRQVDEKIEEYKQSKDFVETVITENKLLSADIKNILKQQIKQIMANIFRLKNPSTALNPDSCNTSPAATQSNFFIT